MLASVKGAGGYSLKVPLWADYNADLETGKDGDLIYTMRDWSGNNRHGIAEFEYAPTLRIVGGKKYYDFTPYENNSYTDLTRPKFFTIPSPAAIVSPVRIWCVKTVNHWPTTTRNHFGSLWSLSGNTGGSRESHHPYSDDKHYESLAGTNVNNYRAVTQGNLKTLMEAEHLYTAENQNGTISNTLYAKLLSSGTEGGSLSGCGFGWVGPYRIGRGASDLGSDTETWYRGMMRRMIIIPGNMLLTERDNITIYFKNLYNINLTG